MLLGVLRRSILLSIGLFVCALFAHAEVYRIQDVHVLTVKSAITPATYDYLQGQITQRSAQQLTVIRLNTPGGLVSTTKDIISLFSRGNHPVAVWVTPEGASAASAGSIIASGAHFIFMAPGTNMGAATPVGLGEDIKESDGRRKALNDLTAMVRALSEVRGRPAAPFEQMISQAKSFTDKEALKLGIIDGVVSDLHALLRGLNGKTWSADGKSRSLVVSQSVRIKEIDPSFGQSVLEVLTNPSTAYFLFLLGAALLYFELQAPGGYVAGSIGAVLLVLAAVAFQVLPFDWGALGLILVGVVCLVLELYVTSYGLLGLAGVGAFALGSLFLFQGDEGFISVQYPVLLSMLLGVLAPMAFLVWYMLKDVRKKKAPENFFVPLSAVGTVMGKRGSHYQVKVRGEIWNATGDQDFTAGDEVTVVDADDKQLTLKIQKKTS